MKKNHALLLLIIISSLGIKIYATDFNQPVTSDALEYNTFAWDISHGISSPPVLHNIGFPLLLSPMFYFAEDFQASSMIQKAVSVILSTITIPVFFLLASRFLPVRYALIATSLIAFEPHIIQNVTFGITEPQYIFLFVTALLFATSSDNRLVSLSFLVAGLATVTRFEGITLFCVISIIYLYRFRRNDILHLVFGIMLFIIPVSLAVYYNIDYGTHENIITTKIDHEISVANNLIENDSIFTKISNSIIYLGWSTFPVFIWFIPIGVYYIARDRYPVIMILAVLAIPGLFAYVRAYDTRYFMQLYPALAILCSYGIMKLVTMPKRVFKLNI